MEADTHASWQQHPTPGCCIEFSMSMIWLDADLDQRGGQRAKSIGFLMLDARDADKAEICKSHKI